MNAERRATPNIQEHLSTAVALLDEQGRLGYMNPAAEILFATSARQAAGQSLEQLAPGADGLGEALRQALETGAAYTERERRLLINGQLMTVDCTITPLAGGHALLELSQLDRHLRISREYQLIAQNKATRELIRGLAHEIKNPLGGLRGAAQLLERELPEAGLREYTQVIIHEADRLQTLVDGLLGPHQPPQQGMVNIHEVLERVRQLVRAEAPPEVAIVRDYDPSIPPFRGAADQLIQAVLNVVRNGLEAVGEQGRIVLRTRTQRQFTIDQTTHKLVARIDIIDSGPGIPAPLQDQIFYPMVTTRAQGSGLGLSISQTLVNQHGGLIECASEPGHTVFTLWLPLEDYP
ncbi:nitrogen regulation protein NR(II) [Alkalilimnicola sp. S0819]|uniref:nitrogen regulation protein NR(II) n=1 Tax=Alkalilimnicola sp. S0819 TaxID=2613922 RepID=UPI00126145B4|nr:nitrogen regulation protein NR(II) [Alkalilimnicola sp. S0819]KAB7622728.1 nitrogen regulation protein NR(II) [Alkalilimnicola sp. S0819]MPQ17368.1 nitrogen regulation protein NR(II) [Alkalilimnicola sp. S0819]